MLLEALALKAIITKVVASKAAVAAHGALAAKAGALGHATLASQVPVLGHTVSLAPEGAAAVAKTLGSASLLAHPVTVPTLHAAAAAGDGFAELDDLLVLFGVAALGRSAVRASRNALVARRRHADGDADAAAEALLAALNNARPLADVASDWLQGLVKPAAHEVGSKVLDRFHGLNFSI